MGTFTPPDPDDNSLVAWVARNLPPEAVREADERYRRNWGLDPDPASPPAAQRPTRDVHDLDLVLGDPPTLTHIVQGLFTAPSLNLLVGNPGSKKVPPRHRSCLQRRPRPALAR